MLILGLLCVKETELVAEKAYEMAINGETLEICHRERPFGMILLNGSKNAEVLCNMKWEENFACSEEDVTICLF